MRSETNAPQSRDLEGGRRRRTHGVFVGGVVDTGADDPPIEHSESRRSRARSLYGDAQRGHILVQSDFERLPSGGVRALEPLPWRNGMIEEIGRATCALDTDTGAPFKLLHNSFNSGIVPLEVVVLNTEVSTLLCKVKDYARRPCFAKRRKPTVGIVTITRPSEGS